MKRQLMEWEKIVANNAPKYTNDSYNSTAKNQFKPVEKWAEDIHRHMDGQ